MEGEEEEEEKEDMPATVLYPTRKEVREKNAECLNMLPGNSVSNTIISHQSLSLSLKTYPGSHMQYFYKATDEGVEPFLSKLQKSCPAPELLEIKLNAQVPADSIKVC